MLNFIYENMGTIIVGLVVLIIVFFIIFNMVRRKKKGKNPVCDSCSECKGSCGYNQK